MVKDSGIICKIIVNNAEDDDDKKIKFDIYIVLKQEWLRIVGMNTTGFRKGMESKVKKLMHKFGFSEDQFYVGSYVENNCQKDENIN